MSQDSHLVINNLNFLRDITIRRLKDILYYNTTYVFNA